MTESDTSTPRVLVAQIGARRRYAVPVALWKEGLLHRFCTDIMGSHPALHASLVFWATTTGSKSAAKVLERSKTELPNSFIREYPSVALSGYFQRQNDTTHFSTRVQGWLNKNRAFCNRVLRAGFDTADTIYGFNTASVELFESAKTLGLRCVLDQTNSGWRSEWRARHREWTAWPEWEQNPGNEEDLAPLAEREEREWQLADHILCGSSHVVDQLSTTASLRDKCNIIIPGRHLPTDLIRNRHATNGSLHVLYVGTLELRKGIQYLHQAARQLHGSGIEFRTIGPSVLLPQRMKELHATMDLRSSISNSELPSHFNWADVLILPSVSEGSAGICCEALCHGLPVITTTEAGSPVLDGITGFVIPSKSHEPIVDILRRIQKAPDLLETLSINAVKTRDNLSMNIYGNNLRRILTSH